MQQLMGYEALPSEGQGSVLALVPDRAAQRMLRHLIRRNPAVRWVVRLLPCPAVTGKGSSCCGIPLPHQ